MTDQQKITWKKRCLWIGGILGGGLAMMVLAAVVLTLLGVPLPEEPETTTETSARTEAEDSASSTESRRTQRNETTNSIRRAVKTVMDAKTAVTEGGSDFSADEAAATIVAIRNVIGAAAEERGSPFGGARDEAYLAVSGCAAFASDVALRTDLSTSREVAFENAGEMEHAAQERLKRENTFATVLYPAARVNCSVAGNAEINLSQQQGMALRFRIELEAARTGFYRAYFKASDSTRWAAHMAASDFVSSYREPSSIRRLREAGPGAIHASMVRSHAEMERDVARRSASVAADRTFVAWVTGSSDVPDVDAALRVFIEVRQEPLSAADVVAMYEDNQRALERMLTAILGRS